MLLTIFLLTSIFYPSNSEYKVAVQKFSTTPIFSKYQNNSPFELPFNPTLFVYEDQLWLMAPIGDNDGGSCLAQIELDPDTGKLNILTPLSFIDDFVFPEYAQFDYPSISLYNDTYYRIHNDPNYQYFCTGVRVTKTPADWSSWELLFDHDHQCDDPTSHYMCVPLFADANVNNLTQDYIICSDMEELTLPRNDTLRIVSGSREPFTWGPSHGGFDKAFIDYDQDVLGALLGPTPLSLKNGNFFYVYNAITKYVDFDFATRLGYAILDSQDPSEVLQHENQPFINSNLGDNAYFNGLTPDPNDCKFVDVEQYLGAEFVNITDCFFGVYSGEDADIRAIYGLYIMVANTDDLPTTTTLTTPEVTSTMNDATTKMIVTTHSSVSLSSTETPSSTPNITSHSNSSKKFWFIGAGVLVILIVIGCVLIWIIRRQRQRRRRAILALNNNFQIGDFSSHDEISPFNGYRELFGPDLKASDLHVNFTHATGKGISATIYKGYLKTETSIQDIVVKIPTQYSKDDIEAIENELKVFTAVPRHPHIIEYFGWCLINNIPGIVTKLALGDLLSHLKDMRSQRLAIKDVIKIILQVSRALEHLAKHGIVHRDVACRNILLFDDYVVKLSDFGLSCRQGDTQPKLDFLTQKRFPIKWLSPEAMVSQTFSEKSDVWAFGVMCFEIFTYGEVPYGNLTIIEQHEFLKSGQRLEKPEGTPDEVYAMMMSCWHETPEDRPSFSEITNRLEVLLEYEAISYGYLQVVRPT